MSVYATLMRGEYDDQLKWPFEGDITIELHNWKEDKGHHEDTFSFPTMDGYKLLQDKTHASLFTSFLLLL